MEMVDSSTRNQSAADGLDAIRCVLERAGVRAGVHQSNSFKPDESRESSALTPPLRFTICDLRFANVLSRWSVVSGWMFDVRCSQLQQFRVARRNTAGILRRAPTGHRPSAQGWRAAPTLGGSGESGYNPNGVVANTDGWLKSGLPQPRCGWPNLPTDDPRVVAWRQPWAVGQNPVGIPVRVRRDYLTTDEHRVSSQWSAFDVQSSMFDVRCSPLQQFRVARRNTAGI